MTFGFRIGFALCLLFGLASTPANGQDSASGQDIAAEIRALKALILEQQRAIEALRGQVETQQAKLTELEARSGHTREREIQIASLAPPSGALSSSIAPQSRPDLQRSFLPVIQPKQEQERESESQPKWYEKLNLRGYVQVRYNRLLETNPNLVCEQCDRSVGNNNGLFIRRARMIFSGDLNSRVFMYFQPDFASSAGSAMHFGQLRDLYFDVNLDKKKEFRLRLGQSKVPFGFENLQSSQNRLGMDRADGLNSAVLNERDLGAYLMYAPSHIRQRFQYLVNSGLKGSGDYGVVAVGVFNGQTANRPAANNTLHRLARVSYPFQFRNGQIIEPSVQTYAGEYTVTTRGAGIGGPDTFPDQRTAFSFVLYPQPIGVQAEYNFGRGPAFNPMAGMIEARRLEGGYAQLMYRRRIHGQVLMPFFRSQYYSGGKKFELDARRYLVRDQELGLEWQPNPAFELTGMYVFGDRTFEDSLRPNNRQKGNLLRLQVQWVHDINVGGQAAPERDSQ